MYSKINSKNENIQLLKFLKNESITGMVLSVRNVELETVHQAFSAAWKMADCTANLARLCHSGLLMALRELATSTPNTSHSSC